MILIRPEVNVKQESQKFEAVETASTINRQWIEVGCGSENPEQMAVGLDETLYLVTRVSIKYDKISKKESTGDNNFEIEEINEQNACAEDGSLNIVEGVYESEFETNEKIHTYQCKICMYRTRQIQTLLTHFTVNHKERVEFELEDRNFINHPPVLKDYGRTEYHHCFFCDYKTNRKDNFSRHMRLKHDDTAEWYNCQICDYKTKDRNHLNRHIRRRHDINVEWHQCQFCDYRTKSTRDLKRHFKLKHDETAEWYQCASCEYKTKAKNYLIQHFRFKHTDSEQYRCEFCEYVTKQKGHLKHHLKIRHDEQAEIFYCNFCQYKTKSKSNLVGHLKCKHVSNKEYKCQICNYKTRLEVALLNHVSKEHGVNIGCGWTPSDMKIEHDFFECSKNNHNQASDNETEFTNNLTHFKIKQEDHTEKETEPYQNNHCDYKIEPSCGSSELASCQFCEYKSTNKKTMISHIRDKHNLKIGSHQCQFCKYRTKRKYDLTRHIKAKHDEKAEWYPCTQCEYKTKDKRNLGKHYKYKHESVDNISLVNVKENI